MDAINVPRDDCSKSFLMNVPDGAVIYLDRPTQSRQAYAELDDKRIELPIFFEVEETDEKLHISLPIWAQWIRKSKKFIFPCSVFKAKDAEQVLTRIKRPMHTNNLGPTTHLLPNTNWDACQYIDENGRAFGHLFSQ